MSEFLGGKTSLGESQVVIAEINSLSKLSAGVQKLYPIDSPEKSLEYRKILIEHDEELSKIHKTRPALEKVMIGLGLTTK